tara:strand:+ start:289 stop:579 length:291 start_codon:yes stop_codon:yes gene_type:complete
MALDVHWTLEAETQLDYIIEYLEQNWTEREIETFFKKLEQGIETISTNPLQQKQSERKEGTYEYQLVPQVTLFYAFDESTVDILLLWSNRMNPENL